MKNSNQKGNGVIGIVIIIAIAWGVYSLFSKDEPETNSYRANVSDSYSNYSDYGQEEPENPYDEGSGHSAGYEWAQENDVSSCGGNSSSFIEGCEEYLAEQEEYEE